MEYLIVVDGEWGLLHYSKDGSFKCGFVNSQTFTCKKRRTAKKKLGFAILSVDESKHKDLRVVERFGGRVVHKDGVTFFMAGDRVYIKGGYKRLNVYGVVVSRKGDLNHVNSHLYTLKHKGGFFSTDNKNGELLESAKDRKRECDYDYTWENNSGNGDALCFNNNEEKRNTEICKKCVYNDH